jgi:hypothetical protein
LSKNFDMKDLVKVDVILNIKVIKNESEINLMQPHYAEKMFSRSDYIASRYFSTSYDSSVALHKNRRYALYQLRYLPIIGSLMHEHDKTRYLFCCEQIE